jgi:hypothetical protein
VQVTQPFNPEKHSERKRFMLGNVPHCNDLFSSFTKADTSVLAGQKLLEIYKTTTPFQAEMGLRVFVTQSPESSGTITLCDGKAFFTASCTIGDSENPPTSKKVLTPFALSFRITSLDVTVPNPSIDEHQLAVEFYFGNTELSVTAVEIPSMTPCKAVFKLM